MGGKRSATAKPPGRGAKRATGPKGSSALKGAAKGAKANTRRSPGESKSQSTAAEEQTQSQHVGNEPFCIVGIGASAGGLEAFTHLLKELRADTGMAFVLVQHLDPKHESGLTVLLSRATSMPVNEVKDGITVERDHVYIIPPNTNLAILHGVLHLLPRMESRGQHLPIDYFFSSLAQDQGSNAIGVILSGTASDGTLGLKAIKANGGITFAQDEKTAKYDGMPRSAVAARVVDLILAPEEIARELAKIASHPYVAYSRPAKVAELMTTDRDNLHKIFILLRTVTNNDFTYYKQSTIRRRILRRMVLHRIERLEDYVRYLQDNPAEAEVLSQDMLIKVTSFFRDPDTFEALKSKVFPNIVKTRSPEAPIRVWVPGCSTGEEVYSIAICLLESVEAMALTTLIQIFGTDISDFAIEKARAGIYAESSMADVSPERLRRFFVKVDLGYQISKTIRNICIFAKQDVLKDPHFSKMDLISCRNVLIYLEPVLQKKVMPVLHYALNPTGFLMLGTSETVGGFSDLFALVDKKQKIYSKKSLTSPPHFDFPVGSDHLAESVDSDRETGGMSEPVWSNLVVQKEADRIILANYAPAGVIINEAMDIIQFRGHTGPYLEPAPGQASFNLRKMAREGLLSVLGTAISEARKEGLPVRKEGLRVKSNGESRQVNIVVTPIRTSSAESYFLVMFEDVLPRASLRLRETRQGKVRAGKEQEGGGQDRQIIQLEQELAATREYLQSVIAQQEGANEEGAAFAEEIQSSNEELQSINEEVQTTKEELQAANEELTTINDELLLRNLELGQTNDDLINLLSSVSIPIIMLGSDLRIRRFTPAAGKVMNFIPADVGRPISHIKPTLNVTDLEQLILEAIETLSVKEREVQDWSGHWYFLRIRPYKTTDNKIDGAVMTLVDTDAIKNSMEQVKEAREARNYAEAVVQTVREPLVILDKDLRVKKANKSFYDTFKVSPEETENSLIYNLGNGQWNIPRLRELLQDILASETSFENFEVDHEFQDIGRKKMILNAHKIFSEDNQTKTILLAIETITEPGQVQRYV